MSDVTDPVRRWVRDTIALSEFEREYLLGLVDEIDAEIAYIESLPDDEMNVAFRAEGE